MRIIRWLRIIIKDVGTVRRHDGDEKSEQKGTAIGTTKVGMAWVKNVKRGIRDQGVGSTKG